MSVYKIEIVDITPSIASDLLRRNFNNRAVSRTDVDRYARDMIAGEFVASNHAILIGLNDNLIDGQHRLMAIVKSGCTVRMPVVTDHRYNSPVGYGGDVGRKRKTSVSIGVSTLHAATATAAYMIHTGGRTTPTTSEVKTYCEIIEPYISLLSKSTRAKVSTAYVVLCAVTQMMNDNDSQYVVDTYNSMVGTFENLSPYARSFFGMVAVDRIALDRSEIIARAMRAFDSSSKDKTRLTIKDSSKAYAEAVKLIKNAFDAEFAKRGVK